MRTIPSVPALAIAAVLLATPFVSAWSSFGAYEPDTIYDSPDWMWPFPGPASADHVYFNAWSSVQTFVNANAGALQTSNEAITMERHSAILGVWVDCNGDGYVGHVESAAYEYSAALLLDDSTCPAVTGDPDVWTRGAHNYNGWVSELVPIGRPTTNDPEDGPDDTRVYVDPLAKIWADQGLPDQPRLGGGTCALNPFPRGTMQSTGGLMNYLDCRYDTMEAWNNAMALIGDPLGLSYPDPENAEGSPMDFDTFGDEHTDHAAVSVFDCSGDPFDTSAFVNESGVPVNENQQMLEDMTGEDLPEGYDLYGEQIYPVNPRTLNTNDPTLPGQTNQTLEENPTGDCDTSNDGGRDFYSLLNEDDFNGDGGDSGKRAATWAFTYHEGSRGDLEDFYGLGLESVTVPEGSGTAGVPQGTLGLSATYNFFASGWYGLGNLVKSGPSTVRVRASLDEPSVSIAPGYHLSFYAFVGPATTNSLQTPPGAGVYGKAQCGEHTSGIHNGWNCDRTAWNRNGDGTPLPGPDTLAFVHDAYVLRDIDCYDGSTSLGVAIGLAAYGDAPCQRPG